MNYIYLEKSLSSKELEAKGYTIDCAELLFNNEDGDTYGVILKYGVDYVKCYASKEEDIYHITTLWEWGGHGEFNIFRSLYDNFEGINLEAECVEWFDAYMHGEKDIEEIDEWHQQTKKYIYE